MKKLTTARPIELEKVFSDSGTWNAYHAAEAWAKERGYTSGSMSHPYPTGLIKGDYDATDIPWKWKNFKKRDEALIDGTITGDFREGPVVVRLFKAPHQ